MEERDWSKIIGPGPLISTFLKKPIVKRNMAETTENGTPEFTPSPDYLAPDNRINDALAMKQPDRIPILVYIGHFLAEYANITRQELYEDPEKTWAALEKATLDMQPDSSGSIYDNPAVSRILGDQMTKWPGYGLGPDGSFQIVDRCLKRFDMEVIGID